MNIDINDIVDIVATSKIESNTDKKNYYKVHAYKEAGDIAFLWSVVSNIDQLLSFDHINHISVNIGHLVESDSYLEFNGTVFYDHNGYASSTDNGRFIRDLKFKGEALTQVTNVFSDLVNQVKRLCSIHHNKYHRPPHIDSLDRLKFSEQHSALSWFKEEFPVEFAAIENHVMINNINASSISKARSKI